MERLYAFLELDMAPALPAMENYVRRASALKRQPHRYSLEQFGLTEARVEDELGGYVREFSVRREAALFG